MSWLKVQELGLKCCVRVSCLLGVLKTFLLFFVLRFKTGTFLCWPLSKEVILSWVCPCVESVALWDPSFISGDSHQTLSNWRGLKVFIARAFWSPRPWKLKLNFTRVSKCPQVEVACMLHWRPWAPSSVSFWPLETYFFLDTLFSHLCRFKKLRT